MNKWFECKVKYQKLMQDGKQKKVNEIYLIEAISFSDAENRTNEILEPYISGEFTITAIKIANFSEIGPTDIGDRWFKCKISYISIDEEKGIERKSNTYMLVQASSIDEAKENLDKNLEGMVSDYKIPSISETKIQDVFKYEEKKE